MGVYKITAPLIINATNKTQTSDASNTIVGIELTGDGITSTIIDSTSAMSGESISILGGFTKVSDMQILNSKGSGIVSNQ